MAKIQEVAGLISEVLRLDPMLVQRNVEGLQAASGLAGGALRLPWQSFRRLSRIRRWCGQLVRFVRSRPDAMQALQRNVWKDAWANGSPDDLLGYLKDNTASLRQVLTPQHLQSLETIGKTTKQVNRVAPTAGRAIDTNPRSAKGKAGTKQVRSFLSKLCVRNVANQW